MKNPVSLKYILFFLLIAVAVWLGLSFSPNSDEVRIFSADGFHDLSDADFHNTLYYISDFWQSYPSKLYTPEDFDKGYVTEEPRFLLGSDYQGEGAVQYATHRLRVYLPTDRTYGISMLTSDYSMRLFIDGEEIDCVGVPGDSKETTVPRVDTRTYYFTPRTSPVELIVQAANFHHREGGWPPSFYIGSAEKIAQKAQRDLLMNCLVTGCLITAGLYHLGLFLLNRRRKAALAFAIACLLLAVRTNRLISIFFPEYDWYVAFAVEYMTVYGVFVSLAAFVRILLPKLLNRWVLYALYALSGLFALATIIFEPAVYSRLMPVYQIVAAAFIFYLLARLSYEARKKNASVILLLAGLFAVSACAIYDILRSNNVAIANIPYLTPVGMTLCVLAYSLVVALEYAATEQKSELLAAMNRYKTEFLSNISHELRTPLTVVSNYAQLTRMHSEDEGTLDDYVREKMLLVTSEAERMAVMVGQLLDIARIEEGHMEYAFAPTDIAALIRDAMSAFYPALGQNSDMLTLDLPESLPSARCDRERVRQALLNLVSNAIRFTRNGTITVSAESKGKNCIAVSVADTGEGIAKENLAGIFDRYYTVPSGSGNNQTGTGLGLHITKHIVEAQGGEIFIESEKGRGTVVTFTLPLAKEDA